MTTAYKPKLIEVALPLAAINEAAGAEGSVGQRPHPKNLHRWWARRPLAAARAVLFASLVDDPSADEALSPAEQEAERTRLFAILERLVRWDESRDPDVLVAAHDEIARCLPDGPPAILDPFGGGGAIPLEAQRLGLKSISGDLNPVATLIQKGLVEVPSRFAARPPVHPESNEGLTTWERAQGLAADIEAYGKWMRDEAERQVGHLYPGVTASGSSKLTPIAWIWARTVESPDPSWNGHVPLVASWILANKKGKPKIWIEPLVDGDTQTISYRIRHGGEPEYERTVNRGNGVCVATGATISASYIDNEAKEGRLGVSLMAVVAEGTDGRRYFPPDDAQLAAKDAVPSYADIAESYYVPTQPTRGTFAGNAQGRYYGLFQYKDYFTRRQLLTLCVFSELLSKLPQKIKSDGMRRGIHDDGVRLSDGGDGLTAYADAIRTYLAFVIDKFADFSSNLCSWNAPNSQLRYVFTRQGIAMTWDFAEVNPFSDKMSSWNAQLRGVSSVVRDCLLLGPHGMAGHVRQGNAMAMVRKHPGALVSTDPPYYDNISYADLADFFYVWLRRNLADVWPDECATLLTPKAEELIANQYRAGSRRKAEEHFESGMADFMAAVSRNNSPGLPATIYYAYKAREAKAGEVRSTGWDVFLQAVLNAGLQVTATWPVRTERQGRTNAIGANALASSIVLACRQRATSAPLASRGEFIGALREELPAAVRLLQSGNIAPVDIAQSTIGPGIKVFSRYAKVVEADGAAMSVSDALAIINDVLGEVLDGEEAQLDADTRFASTWYAQHGYNPGKSGDADGQARAKNTSLAGIQAAGIGEARGGSFRLYERSELDPAWSALSDARLTVWEATQHLVAALERSETEAAELLHQLGGYGGRARQLAYVLFHKATDKGWAEEAGAYNGLITAWPTLQATGVASDDQQQLL